MTATRESPFSAFASLGRHLSAGSADPQTVPAEASATADVTGSIPPSSSDKSSPAQPSPLPARSADVTAHRPKDPGSPGVEGADRRAVFPQVASVAGDMANVLSAARLPSPTPTNREIADSRKARGDVRGISLSDAVGVAVLSHPLMGAQAAKAAGSMADVRVAKAALSPQLQVFAGSGGSYLGTYSNYPSQFGDIKIPGSSRSDAGFTLRQLVYDFGAAKADIARSKSLVDAERLRLADQAEDVALRTVNSYLNLLEQGELIAAIDQVVADNNSFANLVQLSEKQGNGTVADVKRIRSKVIEVEALRTDILTSYRIAQDEFYRLTKLTPNQIRRPPSILSRIPGSVERAMAEAKQNNPSLLALNATGIAIEQQLASTKAQRLPRVDIQGDGLTKHYIGGRDASQGVVDTRLMLMLSYKLLDGGSLSAQADRVREDRQAVDFKTLDEKETIELNVRRFYQALSANRTKEAAAFEGIATARSANSLYVEQFKAGRRTVFEVLDSRMVLFTMQRNRITAGYEQLRAAYGILRNVGCLVETVIRSK